MLGMFLKPSGYQQFRRLAFKLTDFYSSETFRYILKRHRNSRNSLFLLVLSLVGNGLY